MISKAQAIEKVNLDIRNSYSDPEYQVYTVKEYEWGWEMSWMPQNPNKILYGSSNYLVHRNGYMSTFIEIAFNNQTSLEGIDFIDLFIQKATEV